jgi:DNA polymerase III sliding clamp (beta) subunit (PCNA family)
VTLPASTFAAALEAVRFAASTGPDLPVLGGVLVETDTDALLVVMATDRYRLASARVPARVKRPAVRAVLPMSFVDAAGQRLTGGDAVTLAVTEEKLQVAGVQAALLVDVYPDVRRLLDSPRDGRRTVAVEVAELRESLAQRSCRTGRRPRRRTGRAVTGPQRRRLRPVDGASAHLRPRDQQCFQWNWTRVYTSPSDARNVM